MWLGTGGGSGSPLVTSTPSPIATPTQPNPATHQAQNAMGSMGLPVLLSVLQEDRDDIELLRTALESLALSFASGDGPGGTPGSGVMGGVAAGLRDLNVSAWVRS